MSFRKPSFLVTCTMCLVVSGYAGAQDKPEQLVVTLVCGGITADESERMLSMEKAQALTIIFSTDKGSYLSGVATRVEESLSEVHAQKPCGPIGHVNVSTAGQYRIVAEHEGVVRESSVELAPFGGARVVLIWPE